MSCTWTASQTLPFSLDGFCVVLQTAFRDRHRCFSALRKPPQELHDHRRNSRNPILGRAVLHASSIQQTSVDLHRNQPFHDGDEHRRWRLHGRNRASHIRFRALHIRLEFCRAILLDHYGPHSRIFGEHSLWLAHRCLRQHYVPSCARGRLVPPRAAQAARLQGAF
jgi:hypothetical protein